jgi:hypothetical protein
MCGFYKCKNMLAKNMLNDGIMDVTIPIPVTDFPLLYYIVLLHF